jgi:DNA-binding IclR family transcriptional regulator
MTRSTSAEERNHDGRGDNGRGDEERTAAAQGGGVRSARRALEILSLLHESRPVLTTKTVVEETGLPRTTVLRLLETLEESGLLWATGNNRYVAGPSLLRWNRLASRAWQLPANTRELMAEVARETGETVSIYVRYDMHRVCIASAEGTPAHRHVAKVGSEQPLWAGAPAKVLLVDAPDHILARVAAKSPRGPEHLATLERWRTEAAADGFSVSHGEREDGLSVVAVPIRSRTGRVLATVSLAGPTPRFSEERVLGFRDALGRIAAHMQDTGFEHGPVPEQA